MKHQSYHVRRGDTVVVIAGKEKGKRGKIMRVLAKKDRVVIERINLVKRHTKASPKNPTGGIVEKEGSVHVSNVQLLCPKCDKPRRTSIKLLDDGTYTRLCRRCAEQIPAPAGL